MGFFNAIRGRYVADAVLITPHLPPQRDPFAQAAHEAGALPLAAAASHSVGNVRVDRYEEGLRATDGTYFQYCGKAIGRTFDGDIRMVVATPGDPTTASATARALYALKPFHSSRQAERDAEAARHCDAPMMPFAILHDGTRTAQLLPLMSEDLDVLAGDLQRMPMPEREIAVLQLMTPVLQELAVMHANGWRHYDVKPRNIVRRGNETYLIDFEWSAEAKRRRPPRAGTMAYQAPECVNRGIVHSSHCAVDVFSAGITVLELLGKHPFAWESAKGSTYDWYQAWAAWHTKHKGPSTDPLLQPTMDTLYKVRLDVRRLLKRMLHPNPDQRISARDAYAELCRLAPRGADLPGERALTRLTTDRDSARAAQISAEVGALPLPGQNSLGSILSTTAALARIGAKLVWRQAKLSLV